MGKTGHDSQKRALQLMFNVIYYCAIRQNGNEYVFHMVEIL